MCVCVWKCGRHRESIQLSLQPALAKLLQLPPCTRINIQIFHYAPKLASGTSAGTEPGIRSTFISLTLQTSYGACTIRAVLLRVVSGARDKYFSANTPLLSSFGLAMTGVIHQSLEWSEFRPSAG